MDVDRELAAARSAIAARPTGPTAPSLDAAAPLTPLPPHIVAVIVGRAQAGLDPLGRRWPRGAVALRTVVPAAVLALLDAVGIGLGAARGDITVVVVAAVLFVVLALICAGGVQYTLADPLRVRAELREHVDRSKRWQGRTASPQLDAAADAVRRVTANPAWAWASLAGQRGSVDLAAVLDRVDATKDIDLAAALTCYADRLDELARRDDPTLRDTLPETDERPLARLLAIVHGP